MALRPELPLERLVQRWVAHGLKESPRAAALVSELRGRRLTIDMHGTPWSLVLESSGETLSMQATPRDQLAAAPASDARILGTPWSLLALTGADARGLIARGEVRIDGDATVAEGFQELLRHLRPDLEAALARLLGRGTAHLLVRTLRGVSGWARASAWTGARNVAEYLAYERRDLVPLTEAEQFLRGVDCLREQLDRVDARACALEQRLRQLGGAREPA